MKISQKLILVFLLMALLIWVVGGYAVYASRKALTQSIGEGSASLARKILDEIDRDILSRAEMFQTCSKDLVLQEEVAKSNHEFEKIDNIKAYISQKDQEWVSAPKGTITPFMQELIGSELSGELREKLKFYKEKYGYKVFGEVFATNKYGANIAQTGKTSDYYQADEEWWQNAKRDGLYVGDVEYDESSDIYSVAIGIRIDDEAGDFLGAIKAVLNIEEIINIIKTGETAAEDSIREFKLIAKDGKIIYATEEFEVFENVSDELLSLCKEESENRHLCYFIAEGDKPGEGEELLACAHSKGYRDFRGLGWILIVEHQTKEIFAPVAKLRNRILIISVAIAILATLIGLYISRSISRPLAKLRDAAAEIGKGNLNARIEIKSNDEIGQLAASFRKMIKDLKNTTTSIHAFADEMVERKKVEAKRKQAEHELRQKANELAKAREATLNMMEDAEQTNKALKQEIAERRQAEEKIRDLAKFPGEDPNPVLRISEDYEITYVNDASFAILNAWQCERGQRLKSVQSQLVQKVLHSDKALTFELDCGDRMFSVTMAPIVEHGYVNVYAHDITELRLSKENLTQVREQAEMKSRFVSTVSHELRTPLAAMKEGVSIVLEGMAGEINDKQWKFLDVAKRNIERLSRLIDDTLDFQKLGAGKVEFDMRENDVNKIAAEVYDAMAPAAETAGVGLSLNVCGDLPKALLDGDRITQVLTNLVHNALKFTETGSVTIATAKVGNTVQVSVVDTGPGMEQEDLSRIFGEFEQLGRSGERKVGGTGLGLAIARRIVEQHNGKIWAESELGKGTTVSFVLPAASFVEIV